MSKCEGVGDGREGDAPPLLHYDELAFALEGVAQLVIGMAGLVVNSLAIPVLASKRLSMGGASGGGNSFNLMLVFLAVFDNIFIICSVMEGVRKKFGAIAGWHHYAFAHFGYQLQSIAVVSSIFMTVALALERYLAVTRPVEYHNAVQGRSSWKRVLLYYVIPVLLCSALFNLPKFLEVTTVERRINGSSGGVSVSVEPTELRMDDSYIFYYNNVAKFFVTGFLPFAALSVFNGKIYQTLRRRRVQQQQQAAMTSVTTDNTSTDNDGRNALVLFSIVVIFLVCNVPRIALNLHELFTIDQYKKGCYELPFWVLLSATISQLLLVVNSSVNFLVYCLVSTLFRQALVQYIKETFVWCGTKTDDEVAVSAANRECAL